MSYIYIYCAVRSRVVINGDNQYWSNRFGQPTPYVFGWEYQTTENEAEKDKKTMHQHRNNKLIILSISFPYFLVCWFDLLSDWVTGWIIVFDWFTVLSFVMLIDVLVDGFIHLFIYSFIHVITVTACFWTLSIVDI